jgi:hypothetical protein
MMNDDGMMSFYKYAGRRSRILKVASSGTLLFNVILFLFLKKKLQSQCMTRQNAVHHNMNDGKKIN